MCLSMKRIRMNVSVRNAAILAPVVRKKKKKNIMPSARNVEQKFQLAPHPAPFADALPLPLNPGIAVSAVQN